MKTLSYFLLIVTAMLLFGAVVGAGVTALWAFDIPLTELILYGRTRIGSLFLPLAGALLVASLVLGLRGGGAATRPLLLATAVAAAGLSAIGVVTTVLFFRHNPGVAHPMVGAPFYASAFFHLIVSLTACLLAQAFLLPAAKRL